jgi:hypothetical protein
MKNVQEQFGLNIKDVEERYTLEPEVTKKQKDSAGVTVYLITLFKFLKWTWVVPYNIQYCKETSKYRISTCMYKKVTYL